MFPLISPWFSVPTGRKVLPEAKDVVERVLLRRKFTPDPQGSNLMFAFFAQHFTHQFFKTDFKKGPGFTKAGGHGVRPSDTHTHTLTHTLTPVFVHVPFLFLCICLLFILH